MINITESAQQYLQELLAKQEQKNMSVRIFIIKPGSNQAETCLSYCADGDQLSSDKILDLPNLRIFIDAASVPYLKDASIDYDKKDLDGTVIIKAPYAKMGADEHSSVADEINSILEGEINPGLAAHGGYASLVEYRSEDKTAVLSFGGGCQGCSMIDTTVKQHVEKILTDKVAAIEKVQDVTDHTDLTHAYY